MADREPLPLTVEWQAQADPFAHLVPVPADRLRTPGMAAHLPRPSLACRVWAALTRRTK